MLLQKVISGTLWQIGGHLDLRVMEGICREGEIDLKLKEKEGKVFYRCAVLYGSRGHTANATSSELRCTNKCDWTLKT